MKTGVRHAAAVLSAIWLVVSSAPAGGKNSSERRDTELLEASSDPAVVRQGREMYGALCQSCHGEEKAKDTLGDSPSNLFDAKWYHGSRPNEIEHSILNGFLDKGMPPWKDALPPEDTTSLAAYLLNFQKRESARPSQSVPPPSSK